MLALYLLDENNEAQEVRHFCSPECRLRYKENPELFGPNDVCIEGVSDDFVDGTVCDECGLPA